MNLGRCNGAVRLFDLEYMKRFYAERLLGVSKFSGLLNQLCQAGWSEIRSKDLKRLPGNLLQSFKEFEEDCKDLGLLVSLAETRRLVQAIESHNPSIDQLSELASCIIKVLGSELATNHFLKIKGGYGDLLLPLPHFGEAVARVFQSAMADIAEASACLALERFQGCVFHSMLVLERGLKWMCRELNIEFGPFDQWGEVIRRIEAAINALDIPRSDAARREWREFLAGAVAHLRLVKDGWRNHVTHGRGQHYNPEAAEAIYQSVRQFMMSLAEYEERRP